MVRIAVLTLLLASCKGGSVKLFGCAPEGSYKTERDDRCTRYETKYKLGKKKKECVQRTTVERRYQCVADRWKEIR